MSRSSAEIFDGGGISLVEQTNEMIHRFRQSFIRTRKERLLDEDLQATDHLLNDIHLTDLIAEQTTKKLIEQGNSMKHSFSLINHLQKEIKEIAEDLNEVQQRKCCGIYSNGTIFGFSCFGFLKKRRKQKEKFAQQIQIDRSKEIRSSSTSEREEVFKRLRQLSIERRENPEMISLIKTLNDRKDEENRLNRKDFDRFRDFLFERFPLFYGYLDEPDRLINEIDMAMKFHRVDSHLDHLVRLTKSMNEHLNEQNLLIEQIEKQTKESGNLLTDSTIIGNQILGQTNPIGFSSGQKILFNSVL